MSYGANAYSKVHAAAEVPPRELEAILLMKGAAKLQGAKRNWDRKAEIDEAVNYNRKLWTILVSSATDPTNPLPPKAKDDFGKLGIFVLQTLISLAVEPVVDKIDRVIEINAMIASGLRN